MKTTMPLGMVAMVWLMSSHFAAAISPTPGELGEARRWAATRFEAAKEAKSIEPFFSFNYGGRPSAEFLGTWESKQSSQPLDGQRTRHTLTYTDSKTGLVVRCVGIEYGDFPAVEWVVHLQNTGAKDTPILEAIQAIDSPLPSITTRPVASACPTGSCRRASCRNVAESRK